MLRSSFHLTLAVAIAVTGLTLAPGTHAIAAAAPSGDAETLFEDGRKDFGQGFFKSAIEKYEAAYKRSKDALILYNIGQSYHKLYGEDPRLEYLRKAQSTLREYVKAIEADPSLGADPAEVKPLLAEIDAELKSREPRAVEGPTETEPATLVPEPTDPGLRLRRAGIGLMAGGGAVLVIGVIVGGAFAGKGGRLGRELNNPDDGLYAQLGDLGCGDVASPDEPGGCADLRTSIVDTRNDGLKANSAAVVSFAVAGGLGAVFLAAGGATFAIGRKRSKAWNNETARATIVPTLGGLAVFGRF